MKTATEVLTELNVLRAQKELSEKKWRSMVGNLRAPIWPHVLSGCVWLSLTAVLFFGKSGSAHLFLYAPPFFFILLAIVLIEEKGRKKREALLSMVKLEAPDLYAKIQGEGLI